MKTTLKLPVLRPRSPFVLAQSLLIAGSCAVAALTANAGTALISKSSPVNILVPSADMGTDWRGPSYDDSSWLAGVNGVGYETVPSEFAGIVLADSVAEWSSGGKQGENSWINGYYEKSADADGTYQAGDFQPFVRSEGPWSAVNFWDGGAWNWNPDYVPWSTIGQVAVHPNGLNSGGIEHWAIRRWVSTVRGPVTLKFHVRKQTGNPNGNGVTGKVFLNGTEVFSQTIAGNDEAGFTVLIPTTVAVGDNLDFAHTPLGADGDGNDGADGSEMTAQVLDGTLVPPATALADTVNGWGSGAQGENGWFYGVWNKSADADGFYDAIADFNMTDPGWTFDGGHWVLGPGDPPWTTIGQYDWHPNGDNPVHFPIKRWVSTQDGDLYCQVKFGKQNAGCGNGTTLHVWHNGVEKFVKTIVYNDAAGLNTFVLLRDVLIGDMIDFALDPMGTDGSYQDGCDGSTLTVAIYPGSVPWLPSLRPCIATDIQETMQNVNSSVYLRYAFNVDNPADLETLKLQLKWNDGYVLYLNGKEIAKKNAPTVFVGTTLADSIADWSTDPSVVVNGWYYGYFDFNLDGDGVYQAENFTPFPTEYWIGNGYDLVTAANGWGPPWTEIYQEDFHPNSNNGGAIDPANWGTHEMWLVRRWVSTVDGNLKCRVRFSKINTGCGDGIIGYVFHNGKQVYRATIAGNDGVGRDDIVDIPDVLIGDNVDIVMAPGALDHCDSSRFSAVIVSGDPIIPWDGAATARRTATGGTTVSEQLDLTSYIPQLNAGLNVLAIQGLNVSANDTDFLILAELIANRVPVANPDSMVASEGAVMDIPVANLLANDVDQDGDVLMVVGVNPDNKTSAGGSIRLMGDKVHYIAPACYNGADSFFYTVTDASGIPVTTTVSVTVADTLPPVITCPADFVQGNDPDQCFAVVTFVASATDSCGIATFACEPASGAVFPKGITLVTCTAVDNAGNNSTCTFTVTVQDSEAPRVVAREAANPAGKKIPVAGKVPSSGNPDGYFQLLARDNCDAAPKLYVGDSASTFVAGPFASGNIVKITKDPTATPEVKKMAGVVVSHIILNGDGMVYAIDAEGNKSVVVPALLPPVTK